MNATQESSWPAQGEALDFPGLIGLDEIDVSDFPISEHDQTNGQFAVQHPNTPYNGGLQSLQSSTTAHDFAPDNWTIPMDMDTSDLLGTHGGSHDGLQSYAHQVAQQVWNGNPPMSQAHMDGQMGTPVYSHPNQIPPTPNSYELHGADAHLSRQRQAFIEQQVQHQLHLQQTKKDNNFTPLGTPAVTPQESGMTHPSEYAIPGTYFSPLTSPALQAQSSAQLYRKSHPVQTQGAMPSGATSPLSKDHDVDMFVADASGLPERTRKQTKKGAAARSARNSLRQSPAIRAQKRKSAALSSSITAQDLESVIQDPQTQHLQTNLRAATYSTDSSGAGSISPEPLSESLMGPPPRPGSNSNLQSPTIAAQGQKARSRLAGDSAAPATPASLMSIDKPRRNGSASAKSSEAGSGQTRPMSTTDGSALDDFILPPSAADGSSAPTPTNDNPNGTPRMNGSRKTPKLGPLSTAATSSRALSTTASPVISAIASPLSATASTFGKDARARNNKKRGSVSGGSAMVSPALRPKISPSIKPLLPDGANLSDTQQAYLLASKSNYTHLLEGTLLPGVSYPDSLSSGLTSKRTSHKIAEQGRRNRINEALKEMQSLLPPPALRVKQASSMNGESSEKSDEHASPDVNGDGFTTKPEDDEGNTSKAEDNGVPKSGKEKKAKDSPKSTSAASEAKAANSKAATVENAIEYIRALQKERVMLAEAMQAKDNEMNELRRKLRDAQFKLGNTPSSNDTASASPDPGKSDP